MPLLAFSNPDLVIDAVTAFVRPMSQLAGRVLPGAAARLPGEL
jgi:hypothetical protein